MMVREAMDFVTAYDPELGTYDRKQNTTDRRATLS